jgi:hypothetical protein
MAKMPHIDMARLLEADSPSKFTVGVNVFAGPVIPANNIVPVECVFIDHNAGLLLEPYMGTKRTSFLRKYLNLYTRARTAAAALETILTAQEVLNLGSLGEGYTACYLTTPEIYSGKDRQDHHIYRSVYRVEYEE